MKSVDLKLQQQGLGYSGIGFSNSIIGIQKAMEWYIQIYSKKWSPILYAIYSQAISHLKKI